MSFTNLIASISTTIHPNDALAPVYRTQHGLSAYFSSALLQVEVLDALMRTHLGKPITETAAIADFACHYGRLLRALRIATPLTPLIACDIDQTALEFCEKEFGARPFLTDWAPAQAGEPPIADLIVCISLLTHTRYEFFVDVLRLWEKMLAPGGMMVFTFLGSSFVTAWQDGQLGHYGPATPGDIARSSAQFLETGHAFHSYTTPYSPTEYGIGFLHADVIEREVGKRSGLEILEFGYGPNNAFGQDFAVVRRKS